MWLKMSIFRMAASDDIMTPVSGGMRERKTLELGARVMADGATETPRPPHLKPLSRHNYGRAFHIAFNDQAALQSGGRRGDLRNRNNTPLTGIARHHIVRSG